MRSAPPLFFSSVNNRINGFYRAPMAASAATALQRRLPLSPESAKMRVAMFDSKRIDSQLLAAYSSQTGQTIATLSAERPLLLVFLRHFG
jgi:hypothetical protein